MSKLSPLVLMAAAALGCASSHTEIESTYARAHAANARKPRPNLEGVVSQWADEGPSVKGFYANAAEEFNAREHLRYRPSTAKNAVYVALTQEAFNKSEGAAFIYNPKTRTFTAPNGD
ncbi:MAG: hypothetical protein Q7S65_04955, partial [Nanoarchaeota archaeon]|nr:hypothetical protein [Nanoarchaeota archaeon]